jgi:hypothetical protein
LLVGPLCRFGADLASQVFAKGSQHPSHLVGHRLDLCRNTLISKPELLRNEQLCLKFTVAALRDFTN